MILVDDLVELVCVYNFKINEKLICEVYDFGFVMYEGQFCYFGEFYFFYFIEVVVILMEQQLDDVMIIMVLLYDMIEDIKVFYFVVIEKFGEEVVMLVDGVIKLINLQLSLIEIKQVENFCKFFMVMFKDLWVILVKFVDCLYNMCIICVMKLYKQQ